jgi:predicted Holliday junction resolvase-like endonuclease
MFKQVCDSSQATLKEWLNKQQEQAEPEKVRKSYDILASVRNNLSDLVHELE